MLASALITDVSADLLDDGGDRWDGAYHLASINAAELKIVMLKPTAYTVKAVYALAAGPAQNLPDGTATYQSPAGATHPKAIELISITRNMGTNGLTAGAAIIPVDPKDMDEMFPAWRSGTANATVQNYMFNKDDRTRFDVYPPQPTVSMGWIEAIYSAIPNDLAATTDAINLSDEYAEAIKAYMKYRAYTMDAATSEYAADRATAWLNTLYLLLGRKDLIEQRYPRGRKNVNGDQQLQK